MSRKSGDSKGDVRVICRVRPTNQLEKSKGGRDALTLTDETVDIQVDGGTYDFTFDRVFQHTSTQAEVFTAVAEPIVEDVLQGYNATVFAYGQTSSGKTHTMEGPSIIDDEQKGLIPRTVAAIFQGVLLAPQNIEFTVKVSYIEIYMEHIRDLLDEFRAKVNLQVREDPHKGIYVAGATEECVISEAELLDYMALGKQNRAVAATGMNEGSSRSHSVFIITVQQRDLELNSSKSGMLYLVDLAGSEMVRKTGASGQQLEEAKTINKSLSALGQVINALTDDKISHIPYRDSKLTRVLQNSLGGNSKTSLVICVSPSTFNAPETLSTLRFGQRAKRIQNKAVVNEQRSVEELTKLLTKAESAIDMQASYIVALEAQMRTLQAQMGTTGGGAATVVQGSGEGATEGPGGAMEKPPGSPVGGSAAGAADAEAARVITQLQAKVQQLEQELEEERLESRRREEEEERLTIILKEKERLLAEAGELMKEAERHCEAQRERAECLMEEKGNAIAEKESLMQQKREDMERHEFELKEMKLNVEKFKQESDRLAQEIQELTGDAPVRLTDDSASSLQRSAPSPVPSDSHKRGASTTAGGGKLETAPSSGNLPAIPLEGVAPLEAAAAGVLSAADQAAVAQRTEEALNDLQAQLGDLELPEAAREIFRRREEAWQGERARQEGALKQQHAAQLAGVRADLEKRLSEIETQRNRLTMDLSSRVEKVAELETIIEKSRGNSEEAEKAMAVKQRQHMKSLQQRLEQLVAVHRQLLRKFASQELENSDFRKKMVLRDERIKQLETNAKILAANMREQANRHVTELTKLRDQMAVLREDQLQAKQAEARMFEGGGMMHTMHGHRPHEIRNIRGGGGQDNPNPQVRAIRGGGGRSITGGGGAAGLKEKGFLSRLFSTK